MIESVCLKKGKVLNHRKKNRLTKQQWENMPRQTMNNERKLQDMGGKMVDAIEP